MTYRTFIIDAGEMSGRAIPAFVADTSIYHTRSRRHCAVMSSCIGGARIAGFGI